MVTYVDEDVRVSVPGWVVDLESFRRWADADDFPDTGRIWYLKGEVWVDLSKEQIFSHVLVKLELTIVLTDLVKTGQLGLFLGDGLFWSNVQADVGGKPDATFASNEAFRSNRVRLIEGKDEGYVELEGSPNVVIEVVSRSSVHKDKVLLRKAYWEAEVREYWIVDARKEPLTFDVLRHTAKGYRATPLRDGWLKSIVFGKSFRFTQQTTALGHPGYTLAVR